MAKEKKEIVKEETLAGGSLTIRQDGDGNQSSEIETRTEVKEIIVKTEVK